MGEIFRYEIDTFPLFHNHDTESGEQCIWGSVFPVFENESKDHPFKNLNRGSENYTFESYHIHTDCGVCQCGTFSVPTFLIDIHLMVQRESFSEENLLKIEPNQIYLPFFQLDSTGKIDFFKLCMHILKKQAQYGSGGIEIIHTYSSDEAPNLLCEQLEKYWLSSLPNKLIRMEQEEDYFTWKDNRDLEISENENMFLFRRIDEIQGFADIENGWSD